MTGRVCPGATRGIALCMKDMEGASILAVEEESRKGGRDVSLQMGGDNWEKW